MPSYYVAVKMPCTTGLPRDTVQNGFAFQTAGVDPPAEAAAILIALEDFYNGSPPGLPSISDYIAPTVNRPGVTVEIFEIGAGNVLTPIDEFDFTLGASSSGEALPLEVAVCCSFGVVTGVDQLKDPTQRGRVYLGPLGTNALDHSGGLPVVRDLFVGAISESGGRLRDAAVGWSVWSRKNAALTVVTGGFVNNEFDTQRRRQVDATARLPFLPS